MKIKRFSSFSDSHKGDLAAGALIGLGIGVNHYMYNKFKKSAEKEVSKDQKRIYEKLKKSIKDRGIFIEDEKNYGGKHKNAFYSPENEEIKRKIEKDPNSFTNLQKQINKFRERAEKIKNKEAREDALQQVSDYQDIINQKGKKGFFINKNLKRGDILAHEMGHEHYLDGEGKGIKTVGGILHKARNSKLIQASTLMDAGLAVLSGINAEEKGEEEGVLSKYGYLASPIIRNATTLGSEAAASIKGYKMLKKEGADKKTLKEARKNLRNALGTYAGNALVELGTAVGARELGKRIHRKLQ